MTLYRYILKEMLPTFSASLLVFVFIMVAAQMLSITELIVTRGVHFSQVAGMVLFLLPDILTFALPAVTLMSVVVAFLRLSVDSEIIALKSSGISLYQMLPPVAAFASAAALAALAITLFAAPWGNRSFKNLLFKIAEAKADLTIKERVFCEPFDRVVLYVNSFSRGDRVMKDVFVVDRRDQNMTNTIVAREGRLIRRPEERIISLYLTKGTIFMVEKDLTSARTIQFNTYGLNIGLEDIMADLASREKAPHELSLRELLAQVRAMPEEEPRRDRFMRELLEKFSIPLAVLFMGLIGVPLGAQIQGRGRSSGIGISLAVFSTYYLCLTAIRGICTGGTLSPAFAVWIPDLFLLVSCIYLWRRASEERTLHVLPGVFRHRRKAHPKD